jgi:hypothetical protein
MAMRTILYQGMTVTAAAFEIRGSGRFLAVVSIAEQARRSASGNTRMLEPPCDDGTFPCAEDALTAALEFARAVIDGEHEGSG